MVSRKKEYLSKIIDFEDGLHISSNLYHLMNGDINKVLKADVVPYGLYVDTYEFFEGIFDLYIIPTIKNDTDTLWKLFEYTPEYLALTKSLKKANIALKAAKAGETINSIVFSNIDKMEEKIANLDSQYDDLDEKYQNLGVMDYAKKMEYQQKAEERNNKISNMQDKFYQGVDAYYEVDYSIKSLVEELELTIEEIKEEISNIFICKCEYYQGIVNKLSKSSEPILKLLYDIYTRKLDVQYISDDEFVIVLLYGESFVIPKKIYNKYFVNYKQSKREKEDANNSNHYHKREDSSKFVYRPYGDKWFSPEANKNLTLLRKEYAILAKKYHPDNYNGSVKIFVEIQEERANILSAHKFQ